MKAAPLLRAWLHRLREAGVRFHMRHRWTGWDATGACQFTAPNGPVRVQARALVLALGGASWSRLGSDGAWVPWLAARGVAVAPLVPANCGFDVAGGWSDHFSSRFAGQPFKSVALSCTDSRGQRFQRKGEFVATATGVEGSLVYAASAVLRDEIARSGQARFTLDLLPDKPADKVLAEVAHPRGSRSLSSHLKSRLGLDGIKMALLHEVLDKDALQQPERLAAAIKAAPLTLSAARPVDEAISTAGGVPFRGHDPTRDAAGPARRVLRRGDAGLGGAHRRLPAYRLFCQWRVGRARRVEPPLSTRHNGTMTLRWPTFKLDLGSSLALAFFLLSMLLTMLLTLAIDTTVSRQVKSEIGTNLAELAAQTTNHLDRSMFERYREVQLISQRTGLDGGPERLQQTRQTLNTLQQTYPYYAWIGLTDTRGQVKAATQGLLEGVDVSARPWFINANKGCMWATCTRPNCSPSCCPTRPTTPSVLSMWLFPTATPAARWPVCWAPTSPGNGPPTSRSPSSRRWRASGRCRW